MQQSYKHIDNVECMVVGQDDILKEDISDNNVTNLLKYWNSIQERKKDVLTKEEQIRNKLKIFLKERKWTKFSDDETKINISITQGKREVIDKAQVKLFLSEAQYTQVLKFTTYEQLNIITPETKQRINKFLKQPGKMV